MDPDSGQKLLTKWSDKTISQNVGIKQYRDKTPLHYQNLYLKILRNKWYCWLCFQRKSYYPVRKL